MTELRIDLEGACSIYISPDATHANCGKAVSELSSTIEPRFDHKLSVSINKSPFLSNFDAS